MQPRTITYDTSFTGPDRTAAHIAHAKLPQPAALEHGIAACGFGDVVDENLHPVHDDDVVEADLLARFVLEPSRCRRLVGAKEHGVSRHVQTVRKTAPSTCSALTPRRPG